MASPARPSGLRFFDTSGRRIDGKRAQQTTGPTARPRTATACFELRGTADPEKGGPVAFEIQLIVIRIRIPLLCSSGSIGGDICRVLGTGWGGHRRLVRPDSVHSGSADSRHQRAVGRPTGWPS